MCYPCAQDGSRGNNSPGVGGCSGSQPFGCAYGAACAPSRPFFVSPILAADVQGSLASPTLRVRVGTARLTRGKPPSVKMKLCLMRICVSYRELQYVPISRTYQNRGGAYQQDIQQAMSTKRKVFRIRQPPVRHRVGPVAGAGRADWGGHAGPPERGVGANLGVRPAGDR